MTPEYGLQCHPGGIRGYGNLHADVMLVGIGPGKNEMLTGRPFTGQSGNLMRNIMEAVGYDFADCYSTNLLCTSIGDEVPSLEQIIACRPRFLTELKTVAPKLVVLLGATVTGIFMPDRKFGDARGSFEYYSQFDCWLLATNHPAAVLHSGEQRNNIATDLVVDFAKIPQFLRDKPTVSQRVIKYEVSTSLDHSIHILSNLPLDRPVALDVETDNKEIDEIEPQSDNLLCLALSDGTNTYVIPREFIPNNAYWPKCQWTLHYGTFDAQAMKRFGVDIEIVHDTLLMHFCIDERSGRHKLKPLARAYNYAGWYEEKIAAVRTDMRLAESDELHKYNALDAYHTIHLKPKFERMMDTEGTGWAYHNLLLPAVNIFKEMQFYGVPVSRDKALDLARQWLPLYKEKDIVLREMVAQAGGDPKINFDSPQQLSKFIYGNLKLPRAPGGTSTATSKDILEVLQDEHPFINGLIDIRHLSHMLSTYIFGVLEQIKRTNRLHPSPLLHGTVGGRCSYSGPAINTIPRPYMESPYGPELRKLFAAEPGYVILEFDYKQAELWQAYFYSRDPNLLHDLESGDFHRQTAAFVKNCALDQVTDEERFQAKKTNFGMLYLIGIDKLAKQIKRPAPEARVWSNLWKERYSVYMEYTERLFQEAKDIGEIETFTHRKRRFPLVLDRGIINQVVNFNPQSTGHDYILDSIIQSYWPAQRMGAYTILDVHDAIIVHCPIDVWQEVAHLISTEMVKPRFGLPGMPVEVKMGPSWGETKEVKHLAMAAK